MKIVHVFLWAHFEGLEARSLSVPFKIMEESRLVLKSWLSYPRLLAKSAADRLFLNHVRKRCSAILFFFISFFRSLS